MADEEPKLDCEAVLKHLFEHLDCELDPEKSAEVDRHLADCRACFSRAEFERKLLGLVRAAGDAAAPPDLRRRIAQVVEDFDRKS
jgi:anti-sigma factor (TIGR02949 family)